MLFSIKIVELSTKMQVLEPKSKVLLLKKYNKQNKGVWGMPWLSEAMKGVISCEKLRGSAHTI